ncbi:MAG: family 1 glycosylhydrolase, partial [Mycobacteriales bacterium]
MRPLRYGVATSSYQIEGAVDADGRGASIWDTFCAQPGAIADGSSGEGACASYERLDEDLALIEQLGVTAYRFSIAWPRVQPTGTGEIEQRGLDYYERLVDGLLALGVEPVPTLYHWDLPQALEDAGGWPVRDTAYRFADYAAVVSAHLGDRVTRWATHNEPWCAAFLGYASGVHAPGRRDPEAAYAAAHHLLLGHALGRTAMDGLQVGIVLNLSPVYAEPGADPDGVDMIDAVHNRIWLDPLGQGSYPAALTSRSTALTEQGVVQPGDLALVKDSLDWVGINYYSPFRIGPGSPEVTWELGSPSHPYTPPVSFVGREPKTEMGWEIYAGGMTDVLRRATTDLPGIPLAVTENGAAFADLEVDEHGVVSDDDRVAYLSAHLAAVEDARTADIPVEDYFAWS